MLNDLPPDQRTYIVTGYTDLRRSIDGLATIIQAQLQLDPFSTALLRPNWTIALDIQILFRTIISILRQEGAR